MNDKPRTIRESFQRGRAAVSIVINKSQARPTGPRAADDTGAKLLALARKEQETADSKFVNDPASHYPGSGATTVMLNKETPRASLQTRGSTQSRLVVRGCGPVPTRLPKRKPVFVEMVAVGCAFRLIATTCSD